jgi:hypothetical protein
VDLGTIRCAGCHTALLSPICPKCGKEKNCYINLYWTRSEGGDSHHHRIRLGLPFDETKKALERLRSELKSNLLNPFEWGLQGSLKGTVVALSPKRQRLWVKLIREDGTAVQMPRAHYNWLQANPFFKDIPKGYTIHHLDLDETNDDPTNLVLFYGKYHTAYHYKTKRLMDVRRLEVFIPENVL